MCDWTQGINVYRSSERLEDLILECRKGSECVCHYQKVNKGKVWFLFLLKTSQNKFQNLRKKSLHRYHWKHWLDYLWVIFSWKKKVWLWFWPGCCLYEDSQEKEEDYSVHFSETMRVLSRPGRECSRLFLLLSVGRRSEHCLLFMVTHDPCPPRLVHWMYMNHVWKIRFLLV